MKNESRSDIAMALLLHEKEESVWQAALTDPIPLRSFQLQDYTHSSNLILNECNAKFAEQCGSVSQHDLIGAPVNTIVFGRRVTDVVVHNDRQSLPHIVKFVSVHGGDEGIGMGFLNIVGLISRDFLLVGMLGRRRDITHQLRSTEKRQALQKSLTPREFEIFLSLAKGRTVKEIASKAGMMEKTVYFHIENIKRKMHTCGIIEIVQNAYRLGYLDMPEYQ